jgi:hypothetical protein
MADPMPGQPMPPMPQYQPPMPQYQPPMPPQMPMAAKAVGGTAKTAKMLFLLGGGLYFVMCFYERWVDRSITSMRADIACLTTEADCPQPPAPPVEPVAPPDGIKDFDKKNDQYKKDREKYDKDMEKYNKDETPNYLQDKWEWDQEYRERTADVREMSANVAEKEAGREKFGKIRHTMMYGGLCGILLGLIGIIFTGSDVEKAAAIIGAALGIIPRL